MKKELFIPILILVLIVAFAVVSLLVFLNGGRSAKLIRWKLKLIMLLMSFNSMVWGAKAQDESIELPPILYGPPPVKLMLGADFNINYSSGMNLALTHLKNEWIADYNVHGISAGFGGFFQYKIGRAHV